MCIDDFMRSKLSGFVTCTCCNGSGKNRMTVHTHASREEDKRPTEIFEMDCMYCKGTGQMTKAQADQREWELNQWCRCGNPSGQVTFHDDNTRRVCRKHHYTCNDCKKITQIG